jgi:hypothetical protein
MHTISNMDIERNFKGIYDRLIIDYKEFARHLKKDEGNMYLSNRLFTDIKNTKMNIK